MVTFRCLKTNNARDYFNQILTSFQKEWINHEFLCVYAPQQNGVAKLKNSHLLTTTFAALFQYHVAKQHWEEVVLTATSYQPIAIWNLDF